MTFPTFNAAIEALERAHAHLLALPMNDPLVRAAFTEVERQQLLRVRDGILHGVADDDEAARGRFCCLSCAATIPSPAPLERYETWTDLWVHLMTCPHFRATVERREASHGHHVAHR